MKKLIQEIYRNRNLMGLSEKNLNNLITEAAIPPGWTKLFNQLGNAVDLPAAKKIINTFKDEHPDEYGALDKFLKESGGYNFEGKLINSLDNLTRFGKFNAYKALTPFIKSNGDAIVSILAKYKVNKTLPKKITTKFNEFSMDELTTRLIDSKIDEGVKDYLRAFKTGDVGKYSIDEMEGFISLLRRNANAYPKSDAKTLVLKYCDELDNVVQHIKDNQKQIKTPSTNIAIAQNFKKDYNNGNLIKGEYGGSRNLGVFDYDGKIVKVVQNRRLTSPDQIKLIKNKLSDMDNVYFPEKSIDLGNNKSAIIMSKASGVDASKLTKEDIFNIPKNHWDKLEMDIRKLSDRGIETDLSKRDNLFYDKNIGFQFIDINKISIDGSSTGKFFKKDGIEYYYPFERYKVFPKKFENAKKMFEDISEY